MKIFRKKHCRSKTALLKAQSETSMTALVLAQHPLHSLLHMKWGIAAHRQNDTCCNKKYQLKMSLNLPIWLRYKLLYKCETFNC